MVNMDPYEKRAVWHMGLLKPSTSCYMHICIDYLVFDYLQLYVYYLYLQSLPTQAFLFKLDVRICTCTCTYMCTHRLDEACTYEVVFAMNSPFTPCFSPNTICSLNLHT